MGMNTACECEESGFCDRHGVEKNIRQHELCRGINCTPQQCLKYWKAWEDGKMPGQTGPVPDPIVPRGFGDRVSNIIKKSTGIKPCNGCSGRAATLNHMFPAAELPPVERIEFDRPLTRNVTFHVWPVKNTGAWKWTCDELMKRAHLFNGKRIVAIARSRDADHPDRVKEYLKDFTDDFIIKRNNPKLREVVTFVPMLEKLESLNKNEVTFCCHSKCVRHRIGVDDDGSTIYKWTQAMFDCCLDYWPLVESQLQHLAMTGCFKRYGEFRTRGNHRWHYSGTFYWFRHHDVFRRNWRYVDRRFFGTESWPGHMFRPDETDVLFSDDTKDLYDMGYWNQNIQGALAAWKDSHRQQMMVS